MQAKSSIVAAEPYPFEWRPAECALLIIDMQRDFLEPGGFGEMLGNDVSQLRRTVEPNRRLLAAWRSALARSGSGAFAAGPERKGFPVVRATLFLAWFGGVIYLNWQPFDFTTDPARFVGEPVIDKPGKGAFHATDLHSILEHRGITQLVVTGVTTEVCVNTTVREANDRGYDCLVPEDCVGSYFPEFHEMGLRMIKAQGGIFGWVTSSAHLLAALG